MLACASAEAKSVRGKRLKAKGSDNLAVEADESVAEQINDPSSFLREIRADAAAEHGAGPSHATVELTPTLALPLSQRFRFEGGIPVLMNGPGDRNDIELGDIYGSVAYIFASTDKANHLVDLRVDFPTGDDLKDAGQGVAQWHLALGSVFYAFKDRGWLMIPKPECRRSMFEGNGAPRIGTLLGNLGLVYLWSEDGYARGELTVSFDERDGWRDAGLVSLEIGHVFMDRYSVALGYEIDAWGHAEFRNAATFSAGHLF